MPTFPLKKERNTIDTSCVNHLSNSICSKQKSVKSDGHRRPEKKIMFVSRFLRHTGHGMAASPHTLPARGQRRPHGRKTTPAASRSRRPCAPPPVAIASRRAVTGFLLAPQEPREDRIFRRAHAEAEPRAGAPRRASHVAGPAGTRRRRSDDADAPAPH